MLPTLALVLTAWVALSFALTLLAGRMIAVGRRDAPRPAEPAMATARVLHLRW